MKPQEWHKLILEDTKTINRKLLTHRLILKQTQGWGNEKVDDEITELKIRGNTIQIYGKTYTPKHHYQWVTAYNKEEHKYIDFTSYIKQYKWEKQP